MPKTTPSPLMFLPAPLVLGVVAGVVVAIVSGSLLAGVLVLVVAALLIGVGLYLAAEPIVLRLLGARLLAPAASQELHNSLDELCARTGLAEPALYTAGPGSAAIASFGRREPSFVVTDGLVDDLSVIELEAALARELARARSGATAVDTLAVPFLTLPLSLFGSAGSRALAWFRGGDHDARCDLEGVQITRYPPGMSAALEKMSVGAADRSVHAAVAHLWAVGNDTSGARPGMYGVDDRLQLLSEL